MVRHVTSLVVPILLFAPIGLAVIAPRAEAQGCEPIRFTTPIDLAGQGEVNQPSNRWRLTLAYRRLFSDNWLVGTAPSSARAPGGEAPKIEIHTFVADVSYSLTDRIQVGVSVPFSTGTISRVWDDSARHQQGASGIGDISVRGDFLLFSPRTHPNGNLSLGIGLKAPTGSHTKPSQFYTATGPVPYPADIFIQPGDGGWGVTLGAQAFARVTESISAYASGSYMASPRTQTNGAIRPTGPASQVHWSVPDVYDAQLGAAFSAWPDQGLHVSLGGRLTGIPRRDLFGGGDSTTKKQTSRIVYIDPGLSVNRGASRYTLSVPIRIYANRIKSLFEEGATGPLAINGGGFANMLIFASYSHRF
jgi:hypothetical protein